MERASGEEQLQRILYELQMMENTAHQLQDRLQVLTNAAADLTNCKTTVAALRQMPKASPILVPVGGATFVNVDTGDLSKVVIGIGADVSVEMEGEKAEAEITSRLEEVEKSRASVEEQLSQILNQMQIHQSVGQRLSAELQGAPQ